MKSTGMTRKVDELGRIVLPSEIRKQFDLADGDKVEIYTEEDRIILKKYAPGCIFCGNTGSALSFSDKRICSACIERIKGI